MGLCVCYYPAQILSSWGEDGIRIVEKELDLGLETLGSLLEFPLNH